MSYARQARSQPSAARIRTPDASAPTDAERKLWHLLRHGRIDGYRFRRQVPIAGYIIDFCCLSAGLGIEADGGQHCDPKGQTYDQRRSEALRAAGIRIIRFSDYEILKDPDAVQRTIYRELTEEPYPSPPPEYRRRE